MISTNFINTYQWSDQISWNHGKHTIRAGFEGNRVLYNNTIPASGRGELLMWSTADFLTSSSGPAIDGTPATPTGGILLGFGLKGTLTHYNRVNQFNSYVQDDIKVSSEAYCQRRRALGVCGFPGRQERPVRKCLEHTDRETQHRLCFCRTGASRDPRGIRRSLQLRQEGLRPDGAERCRWCPG